MIIANTHTKKISKCYILISLAGEMNLENQLKEVISEMREATVVQEEKSERKKKTTKDGIV